MDEQVLSEAIETLLVARNPRQMQVARAALPAGYYLRAAQRLRDIRGTVLIGTGFPVAGTFETDGPVGAIALSQRMTVRHSPPAGSRPMHPAPLSLSNARGWRPMAATTTCAGRTSAPVAAYSTPS